MSAGGILLSTGRLYLRPFTVGDGGLLHALDADPEVMRFISKGKPTPRERIEEVFLPRFLESYGPFPEQGFWAVHDRTSRAFLGWIHLRPERDVPHEMELGYRFHRAAWGKGYATEGCRALLDRAFRHEEIPRVVAVTLAGNTASRRVMEKLGMHRIQSFHFPKDLLPGYTFAERAGVRYGVERAAFRV